MIEKLKKLGLTGYEAQAYLALLKLGDAEVDEISISAKIPMGRIYNVLSNLEEAHLVRTQDIRPRRYACVEPDAAMDRLYKTKLEELKQESAELESLACELKSQLSGVVARKTEKNFWTVAIGDESYELVRECIMTSRKELLFFLASGSTERLKNNLSKESYTGIMNALYDTIKKGVEIKVILNKDVDLSMIEDSPVVAKLLQHMGRELNCRLAAIPSTPFDIIDGENVLLSMLNPLKPDEVFAVVNIKDTKLADELRKKFYAIWENAQNYDRCVSEICSYNPSSSDSK